MARFLQLTFALALIFASMSSSAQSMKMVVDKHGAVVGRYVKTNKTTYTVGVQDDVEVPIKGNRVVIFNAKDGQGVVYRDQSRTGNINVRKKPSTDAPIVAKIADNTITGNVPDCYDCLGKVNGWYKIRIDGKIGFVRSDLVEWNGMCSF
jgi:uncharacterized protein YgiM (DUF1202 family)